MAPLAVFDAKVVYDEDEEEGAPGVVPEAGCCGTLLVPVLVEAFGEKVVCKFA